MSRIKVHRIPVLQDNYSYLIEDTQEKTCVVVDPAEAGPVNAEIDRLGLKPVMLWNTHHHADHIDGNAGVLEKAGNIPVFGSAGDKGRIAQLTQLLKAGDIVEFGGDKVRVLEIPGHTLGHIAYYLPSGHLFSGDLLFGYSCGKVFEGTMEQMYDSVRQVGELPDDTLIYCGHEYTLNNRKFAEHVEPDNPHHTARRGLEMEPPTVPLKLALEKQTNPFLRVNEAVVQAFTGKTAPAEVFGELRRRKDNF